jgi:flagellar biosynthesis chaperone FliJ
LALASNILVSALVGISALIGIGVLALLAWFMWMLAPWVGYKVALFATDRFVNEIYENPIPAMMHELQAMQKDCGLEEQDLLKASQGVAMFAASIKVIRQDHPGSDELQDLEGQLSVLNEHLQVRYAALTQYKADIKAYDKDIDKKRAIWDASQIGRKAGQMIGRRAAREAMHNLVKSATTRAIRDSVAKSQGALAHLKSTEMSGRSAPPTTSQLGLTATPAVLMARNQDGAFVIPTSR